jgi:polysaccharide pyruvyl transferase WcaK-like protein
MVVCGTNLYQHQWPSALDRRTLKAIGVPIIPIAVGSSAASLADVKVSRTARRMIRLLHEQCEVGSVRDPHSAEVVSRCGVRNYSLTGCAVMQWSLQPSLPVLTSRPRSKLIVTARNWLMHREPHNVDDPTQILLLKQVIDSFDGEIIYAVHEPFDRNLISPLGLSQAEVFETDDPDKYLELYSDPDALVLGSRLHAGICALAQGVPTIFVGHDTRTYSFCDLMGLEYVELFDADAAERAIERVGRIAGGDVGEFSKLGERYQDLRVRMREVLVANDLPTAGFD